MVAAADNGEAMYPHPRSSNADSSTLYATLETAESISPVPAAEEAGDRSANPGPKEGGEAAVAAAASASSTSVHRQRPFKAGDLQATDAIPIGNGEIQAGHSDFEAAATISPPLSVATSETTLLPSTAAEEPILSPDARQISLPKTSSEALEETEVVELQAFVSKQEWIEEKIGFLRGLPPIECFALQTRSFAAIDGMDSGPDASGDKLPTQAELDEMLAEQDRIEEEADRFNGGDLERLRKMAKAASKKSLSRSDTDLLSITLSTLYLLDTLLHLLRSRGETLDLLALRLDWDALRFSIAHETRAIQKDVQAFAEDKARWAADKYEGHTKEGSSGTSPSRSGRASNSQRYLLTQILELDAQALHNRSAALQLGLVAQSGKVLDRMIDLAASIRSHSKRKQQQLAGGGTGNERDASESATSDTVPSPIPTPSAANADPASSEPVADTENEGAVPEWFLDEQDRVEEQVGALGLWDQLAGQCVQQWKFADPFYHKIRKLSTETEAVSAELADAHQQHPSPKRSQVLSARMISVVADISSIRDPALPSSVDLPCPSHPALPNLPRKTREIASFLAEALRAAKEQAKKTLALAEEYKKLAERTRRLDELRSSLDSQSTVLEEKTRLLDGGVPNVVRIDLSDERCLRPEAHAAYLAHVPLAIASINSTSELAAASLRETRALLAALRSATVDPAFRNSVETAAVRLETALLVASTAKDSVKVLISRLEDARRVAESQQRITLECNELHGSIVAEIEASRWLGRDQTAPLNDGDTSGCLASSVVVAENLALRVGAVALSLESMVAAPLGQLSGHIASEYPHLNSHFSNASSRLANRISALHELVRLLECVRNQTRILGDILSEDAALSRRAASLQNSIDVAAQDSKAEDISPTTLDAGEIEAQVSTLTEEVTTFVRVLPFRLPLISSPSFAGALIVDRPRRLSQTHSDAPLTPPRSPADEFFAPADNLLDTVAPGSSAFVDLSALDALVRNDTNLLVATLSGRVDRLKESFSSIAVAKQGHCFDNHASALEGALGRLSSLVVNITQGTRSLATRTSTTSQDDFSAAEALHAQLVANASRSLDLMTVDEARITSALTLVTQSLLDLQTLPHASVYGDLPARTATKTRLESAFAIVSEKTRTVTADSTALVAQHAELMESGRSRLAELARVEEVRLAAEEAARQSEAVRLEKVEAEAAQAAREVEARRVAREKAARRNLEQARAAVVELPFYRVLSTKVDSRILSRESEAASTTLPRSALFPMLMMSSGQDDVFGPVSVITSPPSTRPTSPSQSLLSHVTDLIQRLKDLDLEILASTEGPVETPSAFRHLPSAEQTARCALEIEAVDTAESAIRSTTRTEAEAEQVEKLLTELTSSYTHLRTIHLLASFSAAAAVLEAELSELLDAIDASDAKEDSFLGSLLKRAAQSHTVLLHASGPVAEDPRVASDVSRIGRAFVEMQDMAAERLHPSRSRRESIISVRSGLDSDEDGVSVVGMSRSSSTYSISSSTVRASAALPTSFSSISLAQTSTRQMPSMMSKRITPRSVSGPSSSPSTLASRIPAPSPSIRPRASTLLSPASKIATPIRLRVGSSRPTVLTSPSPFNPLSPPPLNAAGSSTRPPSAATPSSAPPSAFVRPRRSSSIAPTSPHPFSFDLSLRDYRPSPPPTSVTAQPRQRRDSSRHLVLDAQVTPTGGKPVSPGGAVAAPEGGKKRYRARKDDKLDRAVGRIVNALPVDIPIVAVMVGVGPSSESGKYWIGQPPKLCFCRILRSKTVMVRVGGGWVELSKFLLDHFGIHLPDTSSPNGRVVASPPTASSWVRGGGGVGTTPSSSTSFTASAFVAGPTTPIPTTRVRPASPFANDSSTPPLVYATPSSLSYRTRVTASLSPTMTPTLQTSPPAVHGAIGGVGSPASTSSMSGSPVVPLNIMRRVEEGELRSYNRKQPRSIGRSTSERFSLAGVASGSGQAASRTMPHPSVPSFTPASSESTVRQRVSIPWR